ncbi:TnsA endonuclease N-terminal domain-containing protein [Comamonas aquatica]|uniref:TnsA endonuclease N-terminal domain-containing protein n=1 Tax=Comamonas aquatica TaxID=225991 RepID=UPI0009DF67C4|nr:TnsA endonuclease N-terminal domain-containing protein [Comamonas aquatica]
MVFKKPNEGSPAFDPRTAPSGRHTTSIPDPLVNDPARQIVGSIGHREVGVVNASWLLNHPVEHETYLEKRFIMVALACPVVANIEHQPETIKLFINGKQHSYTPDFRVTLKNGEVIICEIKAEKFLQKTAEKRDAAQLYYEQKGGHYLTFTQKQIDHNNRAARAILLMRYGRIQIGAEKAQQCKTLLEREASGSLRVAALLEHGISESVIWHMVATHSLRTQTPLNNSDAEPIQLNQDNEDCYVQFVSWFGTEVR